MLSFRESESWPEDASKHVVDGLAAFNAEHGSVSSERKFGVFASDAHGTVVGGVLARADHAWCYIGWLWVSDGVRGQGVGTQLMSSAERMALKHGCRNAHLTTLEFQAKDFYLRRGYAVFGVLEDYPAPYKRFFMRKVLAAP